MNLASLRVLAGWALLAATHAAAVADDPAADAQQMNLLGEVVRAGEPESSDQRPIHIRRVEELIGETSELQAARGSLRQKLQQAEIRINQIRQRQQALPNEKQVLFAEGLSVAATLNRLAAAGVLNLPPKDPNFQRYRLLKIRLAGINGAIQLLKQEEAQLPVEMATLRDQIRRDGQHLRETTKLWSLHLGHWLAIVSPLSWMSTADAGSVRDMCLLHLDGNPSAHHIRLMLGFSYLHLQHHADAVKSFEHVLKELRSSTDSSERPVMHHAMLGWAWSAMAQGDFDHAGRLLASADRIDRNSYELRISEGILARHREQYSTALQRFHQATRMDPTRSHAERHAAELIEDTAHRPLEMAVALARESVTPRKACDWRDHLLLARLLRTSGDQQDADRHFAKAVELAPPAARAEYDGFLEFAQPANPRDASVAPAPDEAGVR